MPFKVYSWVGLKKEKYKNAGDIEYDDSVQQLFFVREILSNDEYVCDYYEGENHIRNHYIAQLNSENCENKEVKATFNIREYYPDTARFVDNPRVFNSIAEIEEAITNNEIKTPLYSIWKISIFCDSDCRALGIDPAAPWPPKAA